MALVAAWRGLFAAHIDLHYTTGAANLGVPPAPTFRNLLTEPGGAPVHVGRTSGQGRLSTMMANAKWADAHYPE